VSELFLEGLRVLKDSWVKKLRGYSDRGGNAEEVCENIIKASYQEGRGFSVFFKSFFCRDFAWCVKPLIRLGYEREVKETLSYALKRFSTAGRIRSAISRKGVPFNVFSYEPGALASILYCLDVSRCQELVDKHKKFLEGEIAFFEKNALEENGLVRRDKYFPSIKDQAVLKSSCYNNVMAWLVQRHSESLGLRNELQAFNYKKLLRSYFWNKEYFLNDLSGQEYVSGDANVFPYWAGLEKGEEFFERSVKSIQREGLDKPFPLKYTSRAAPHKWHWSHYLLPGYESTTTWTHLGVLYIEVLKKRKKKLYLKHHEQYRELIERHRNYLEVFKNGKPYSNLFYQSCDDMLWCSVWLAAEKG